MSSEFPRLEVSPALRRKMVEIARQFRKEPTPSEAILWQALRGKKLDGLKFRRQQPIGPFIVDFYNSKYRLVIEVDGRIHDRQVDADRARQEMLEILGLNILRLKAEMVETDLPAVLTLIRAKIRSLHEVTPFHMGEGQTAADSPSSLAEAGQAVADSPSPLVGEGRGGG